MTNLSVAGFARAGSGPYSGKAAGGKALSALLPGNLGIHGIAQPNQSISGDTTLTLPSAAGAGEAGNLITNLPTGITHLGPHGIATQEKSFPNKGLSDATVVLVGAAGLGQAEELEGASVTITLDGARGFGRAGLVFTATTAAAEGGDAIVITAKTRRIMFDTSGNDVADRLNITGVT